MRFILNHNLVVLIGCVALISLAIAIGHIQPPVNPDLGFHLSQCGNNLCFLGIEAGVTDWQTANVILRPYKLSGDDRGMSLQIDGMIVYLKSAEIFADHKLLVSSIELDNTQLLVELPIRLRDIVARLGVPCGMALGESHGLDYEMISYPEVHFMVTINATYSINEFDVLMEHPTSLYLTSSAELNPYTPESVISFNQECVLGLWQGFSPWWLFQQRDTYSNN